MGGEQLHEWIFAPETDRTPTDDRLQARGTEGIGATIMEKAPPSPQLLGGGERLFEILGAALDGWRSVEFAPSASVTHVRLRHL